ncbi:hypothetical protein RO3G_04472 [Lichtheimia corymbifera JMRC:FSU:9682]|uniref:C2H2-type domain-containing protein n=1 Tax=Lichtheimia corymbifera JMRC:FSU:9682 TaxID=1263082 RepID=A0A068RVE2_9FUNG|nr:hypothetical protein RO3G_04472 [Lichtheimia corymbifera JMRC:FSU:9682]
MNQSYNYEHVPHSYTSRPSYRQDQYPSTVEPPMQQPPPSSRSPVTIAHNPHDRQYNAGHFSPLSHHVQTTFSYLPPQSTTELPVSANAPPPPYRDRAQERGATMHVPRSSLPMIYNNEVPGFNSIGAPSGIYHQPHRYSPHHADIIAHHPSFHHDASSHTKLPPLNPSTTTTDNNNNNDDDHNGRRWNNDPMIRNDDSMMITGSIPSPSFTMTEKELEPYGCGVGDCRATYPASSALFYHVKNWHGADLQNVDKPFRCAIPNCVKRYKNINGLQYHLREAKGTSGHPTLPGKPPPQPQEKIHKCRVVGCKKAYRTANGLKYHQTHAHQKT